MTRNFEKKEADKSLKPSQAHIPRIQSFHKVGNFTRFLIEAPISFISTRDGGPSHLFNMRMCPLNIQVPSKSYHYHHHT